MGEFIIDVREPPEIAEKYVRILAKYGITPEIKPLPAGDIVVNDLCIERKKPIDFIHSIKDGRLFSQAVGIKDYNRYAIVVEGRLGDLLSPNIRFGMNVNSIMGAVASLTVDFGIPTIFMDKYTDLVLYHMFNHALKTSKSELKIIKPKTTDLRDSMVAVIASLPGIGAKKARMLLGKFGSVANTIANIDKWVEVEGIGEKTVLTVKEVVFGRYEDEHNNKV